MGTAVFRGRGAALAGHLSLDYLTTPSPSLSEQQPRRHGCPRAPPPACAAGGGGVVLAVRHRNMRTLGGVALAGSRAARGRTASREVAIVMSPKTRSVVIAGSRTARGRTASREVAIVMSTNHARSSSRFREQRAEVTHLAHLRGEETRDEENTREVVTAVCDQATAEEKSLARVMSSPCVTVISPGHGGGDVARAREVVNMAPP